MPILDIPGIVHLKVKLDYGRYQQFMTVAYKLLHREELINSQSDFNNRVVASAIERTIQDLVEAAILTSNPEQFIELLEKNTVKAYDDLATKFIELKVR